MNGELNDQLNVIQNMKDIGHAETAISVVNSLPFNTIMLFVFFVVRQLYDY